MYVFRWFEGPQLPDTVRDVALESETDDEIDDFQCESDEDDEFEPTDRENDDCTSEENF